MSVACECFLITSLILMPAISNTPSARPRCQQCTRPVSHCLCSHISVTANRTAVLVLQHPSEQKHPLNTARLAVAGLQQAELQVGEYFSNLESQIANAGQVYLLFPGEQALSPVDVMQDLTRPAPDLLIVPDGTWRKAGKILRVNPILATLPRLSLAAGAPSAYRVRKAPQPNAVATIEAIVRTLSVLEPEQDFAPVLYPFDVLVAQQIHAMGPETYQRNHKGKDVC